MFLFVSKENLSLSTRRSRRRVKKQLRCKNSSAKNVIEGEKKDYALILVDPCFLSASL